MAEWEAGAEARRLAEAAEASRRAAAAEQMEAEAEVKKQQIAAYRYHRVANRESLLPMSLPEREAVVAPPRYCRAPSPSLTRSLCR